jgi:hypothetical protein
VRAQERARVRAHLCEDSGRTVGHQVKTLWFAPEEPIPARATHHAHAKALRGERVAPMQTCCTIRVCYDAADLTSDQPGAQTAQRR